VSGGVSPHALVFDRAKGLDVSALPHAAWFDAAWIGRCREFLDKAHQSGIRTIEDTRAEALRFLSS
jgi:hypothetical protein